jgi:hypothetical protein
MEPADLLPKGRTRETKIRRDSHGRWFNDGVAVTHRNLTDAFDRWLGRAPDGRYALENDINWAYVTIDGPARFVESVVLEGAAVTLRFRGGFEAPLDPATLREGPEGALYAGDALPARFSRSAMMDLAECLDEDEAGPYLRLGGGKVRPPRVDDPLAPRQR